jgi:hypothetical protein
MAPTLSGDEFSRYMAGTRNQSLYDCIGAAIGVHQSVQQIVTDLASCQAMRICPLAAHAAEALP